MTAKTPNPPIPSAEMLNEMAAKGTRLRRERAEFLDQLRDGVVAPEQAVEMLHEARKEVNEKTLGKIRALNFLLSVPYFGRVTAQQTLLDLRIMPKRHLAAMNDKQADKLAAAILDKVSIRALVREHGVRALPLDEVVGLIRTASTKKGGTLRYLRVRDVVGRLPRLSEDKVFSIIEGVGIDVNARFTDLDRKTVNALIKALPEPKTKPTKKIA